MSLRAVIFDFDGLILDTELPEFLSWCEVFEARGKVLDREVWCRGIGTRGAFDPYAHLETMTGSALDREAVREERRRRYHLLIEAVKLQEGVEPRLAEARDLELKIGMTSSSDRSWIEEHLAPYGLLTRFDVVKCVTDGLPPKPDPALYVAALEALGCGADEAVAFEDSPNGIAAAKAAGLFCIAVPNEMTSVLDLSAADEIVGSLAAVSLAVLIRSWPAAAHR